MGTFPRSFLRDLVFQLSQIFRLRVALPHYLIDAVSGGSTGAQLKSSAANPREATMKTIVVDDNEPYAEALAGDEGTSLFSGERFSTLPEMKEMLDAEIERIRDVDETVSIRVLINRELKFGDRNRQEALGQTLYQQATWKYPEVPFRLYSFRSLDVDAPCTRLPFAVDDLPELDDEKQLEAKERACIAYVSEEFDQVQHNFDEVDATTVNLVRLIYGAVLSRKITKKKQINDLLDVLVSFGTAEQDNRIESFISGAERLMELLKRRTNADQSGFEGSKGSYRRVVIVEDEVSEGSSPWATVLNILFERDGYEFEFQLPTEAEDNLTELRGADLVLLDIDFSEDPSYGGSTRYGGLDLLDRLQTLAPDLPVVMMSSYDQIGLYEACMERGAHNYLRKQWSDYTKRRTEASEKQWFGEWDQTIRVPLEHRSFFKDMWVLRSRNIAVSALPSLHRALRNVQSPDLDTARALASFLETFASSYIKANPSAKLWEEDTELRKLHNQLLHPDLKDPEGTIRVTTILRKMRNCIVHHERYVNQKLDTWLFLVLLRVLLMRALHKPSEGGHSRTPDCSWMRPFMERYKEVLDKCSTDLDRKLFGSMEIGAGGYYQELMDERKQLLENLSTSAELSQEEFRQHIETFVRLIAPLVNPYRGFASEESDDESTVLRIIDVISSIVKTGEEKRYEYEYEIFTTIKWLIDSSKDFVEVRSPDVESRIQNKIRWFLSSRIWIWYFQEFVGGKNKVIFDRFAKYAAPEADYLKTTDEDMIGYLSKIGMYSYVTSYSLLVACRHVQEEIRCLRNNIETEIEGTSEKREKISRKMASMKEEVNRLDKDISTKKQELKDARKEYRRFDGDHELLRDHQRRVEKIRREYEELKSNRKKKMKSIRKKRILVEEKKNKERKLKNVLETFPAYEDNFPSIRSADRLEEYLRLGLAEIAARRNKDVDPEPCIAQFRDAQDFEDVVEGMRKLHDLIDR